MGKKGKRSGFGGSGNGASRGGGPRPPSGLVVVNPMLLQSMAAKNTGPVKPPPAKSKIKPAKKHKQAEPMQHKRKQREASASDDEKEENTKANNAQLAKKPRRASPDEVADSPLYQLQLAREDQCLAGLYWVLLTRPIKRSAVVAIQNGHATLSPSLLALALKSLGFQALALHSKMTPGQRKHNVERLGEADNDKFVLVTNDHWLGSAACSTADLVAFGSSFVGKSTVDTKFASVIVVHADATVPARGEPYAIPLENNATIQQLQARLKIAMQIATTLQRLPSRSSGDDADTKWATKFAKGADLSDDDDEHTTKKKKKTDGPEEQRLRAFNEKLLVLLARNLNESSSKATGTGSAPTDDAQHRAEKLKVLGITMMSAAMGSNDGERLSAQTQWLDCADGRRFGGDWSGAIRHGASKDSTSLAVRELVCACLSGSKNHPKHLRQWRPNKQPADVDAWGGAYGKVCGHNEVVMHHLRPFFPQEVLNSRVCSKRQSAPGNQGFDGCLEFLRFACCDGQQCMTVWDTEQLVFLSKTGRVRGVPKLQFLSLPLAGLQTVMTCLRQWTLACEGRQSPVLLLEGIRLCCRLGTDDIVSARLPDAKVVRRVLAFAVGGSMRVWKQIVKMPRPIAYEVLYDA